MFKKQQKEFYKKLGIKNKFFYVEIGKKFLFQIPVLCLTIGVMMVKDEIMYNTKFTGRRSL